MSRYPKERYNLVVHQHPEYDGVETIAFSTYAGKAVYGKAICRVDDNYDPKFGEDLAIARCANKIAQKRMRRAARMIKEAEEAVKKAMAHLDDMAHYYSDARNEMIETTEEIEALLDKKA